MKQLEEYAEPVFATLMIIGLLTIVYSLFIRAQFSLILVLIGVILSFPYISMARSF